MWESLTIGFGISATAIFAALGSLLLVTAWRLRQTPQQTSIFVDAGDQTVLLFDGQRLTDATPAARRFLALSGNRADAWTQLLLQLSPRFPDIAAQLDSLPQVGSVTLSDDGLRNGKGGSPLTVHAEWLSGLMKISLTNPLHDPSDQAQSGILVPALTRDLGDLTTILTNAPLLIWREDAHGVLLWANAPYILHVERELPPDENLRWPLPRLFDAQDTIAKGKPGRRRLKTRTEDGALWFDIVELPLGGDTLFYAVPADAAVQAEFSLKEFMQTLTKTFAHLSTGLAIFDQHRRMQLFNPAILDLTGLPIELLSQRPTLHAFLDALRDVNMIPEPKNYRTWRERIVDIELAAEADSFEETWTLPNGRVYRVTGRPHPNQALALVFEDISGEMLQTRHNKAAIAQSHEVLDAMEDAVILFSTHGKVARTNSAYAKLWDHDAGQILESGGIDALIADWQDISVPAKGWAKIRDFVVAGGAPNPASGEVRMNDGRSVGFRCVLLQDGACLVIFRVLTLSLPFEVVPLRAVLKTA